MKISLSVLAPENLLVSRDGFGSRPVVLSKYLISSHHLKSLPDGSTFFLKFSILTPHMVEFLFQYYYHTDVKIQDSIHATTLQLLFFFFW